MPETSERPALPGTECEPANNPWLQRHSVGVTLLATVVIAFATAANVVISYGQWAVGYASAVAADTSAKAAESAAKTAAGQLQQMAAQTPELIKAADAAKAAADAASSAAKTAAAQLAEMARQTPEIIKAADAARSAADTAEKALIDVERPFLVASIDIADIAHPAGPNAVLSDSYASDVQMKIVNRGKQIGILDRVYIRIWFAKPYDLPNPEEVASLSKPVPGLEPPADVCIGPDSYIPKPVLYTDGQAYSFSCEKNMSRHDYNAYLNADGRIFMQWYFVYSDSLGITRESGATWMYGGGGKLGKDGPTHGFQPYPEDADHNYDGRRILTR